MIDCSDSLIVVPKNSGLQSYREKAFLMLKNVIQKNIVEVRGEDVPFWVKEFILQGKNAIGMTGEDLFKEYSESTANDLSVLKRIEWRDNEALFGKPALCLLGPEAESLETLPKNLKVCVASKYNRVAGKYLSLLEQKGFSFRTIYVNGSSELGYSHGIADLLVDIVYTGKSMKQAGLKVYDKIMESDFVIIGKKTILPKKEIQQMQKYEPPLGDRKNKLRLDFNENTIGCSPKVVQAIRNVNPAELCTYPYYEKLIEKLSKYLNISKKELIITNGADEAIKTIIDTFVSKYDEVIIPVPTFSMFNIYSSIAGARIVEIPYNNDLSFPIDEMLKNIGEETKLVVVVNPNNPTGTAISEEDLIRIVQKAKNSIVIIDEAYWQFYGKTSKELIKKYDNVIVIQTFSKAFGLAGLRLGYAISNNKIIGYLRKATSPYSVNNIALIAGAAALTDTEFVDKYVAEAKESRAYMEAELSRLGIKVYPSQANFILADFKDKCEFVCKKLKEKGILVRNRSNDVLLKGCIRISTGTIKQSERTIKEIKEILRPKILLFDMDGVLVDVGNSYRAAIRKTAEYFTSQKISQELIQQFKEKGYNNDWDLTEAIVYSKGIKAKKADIIMKFQDFYLGANGTKGLIENEKWLMSEQLMKMLYMEYRLGIVTGRPKKEAMIALDRFECKEFFDCLIAMEDCPEPKPNPASINMALEILGKKDAIYFGDNIDDMKCAKNASIRAVGVAPPGLYSEKLKEQLMENGANTVLKNINQIKEVLK